MSQSQNPLMYDRIATWLQVVFVILAFVGGLAYFVSSCDDCDSKGGVLIQDAKGLYQCVPKQR